MRDLLAIIGLVVCLTWANGFAKKYDISGKLDKIEKIIVDLEEGK